MGVGDDVAVRADDDSGSAGPPQPERGHAGRIVRHLLIPLRGHHRNGRGDLFRNPDERFIQSATLRVRSGGDLLSRQYSTEHDHEQKVRVFIENCSRRCSSRLRRLVEVLRHHAMRIEKRTIAAMAPLEMS